MLKLDSSDMEESEHAKDEQAFKYNQSRLRQETG